MRLFVLPIILLTLYSCNQKHSETSALTSCEIEKQQGIEDYKKGEFHFINNEPLRFESELKDLLDKKGIKYSIDPFGHNKCYSDVMDSLIGMKFGDSFINNLKTQADNLFFERRKNGTFEYYEVDTWALRKKNDDQLGGDFVINYLNAKLKPNSLFRYVANTVDRPHFVIQFTVNKDGTTTDVEIKERNNTVEFKNLEETIIIELNKAKDWIPATIKKESVTAKFQRGIAIESKQ